MRKTARPVVWDGGRAQSRSPDPIARPGCYAKAKDLLTAMKFSLAACVLLARMTAAQTQAENFEDLARRAEAALDKNPAQAASLYKEALDLRPSWPDGWFYMGGALYRLDRYTEAREAFHKGLDLSPQNMSSAISKVRVPLSRKANNWGSAPIPDSKPQYASEPP
jgi:tetratricopeptide (TPR) repeat protein